MAQAVTTILAKKKMLLARAGFQSLPKITQMAFGDGGADSGGEALDPGETQQELNHELCRKDIDEVEIISDTKIRYRCVLGEDELQNQQISELALVDADGDLLTVKNFKPKGKDSDFIFKFEINDTM